MFFALSKIFAVFLMPVTWIILLMLIPFFLRKKTLKLTFRLLALLLLLAFTNSYLTRMVVQSWEIPISVQGEITQTYEVGIVLGAGQVQTDEMTGEIVFMGNTDRFLKAVGLYKSGKIRKVLLSGGGGSYFRRIVPEVELLKTYLSENGIIPVRDIWVDTIARNTHENAVECKKIMTTAQVREISLLITSGTHMSRSMACFAEEQLPVAPFVSSELFPGNRTDFAFYVIPSSDNLQAWDNLFHEWFGWFFYRISGYI